MLQKILNSEVYNKSCDCHAEKKFILIFNIKAAILLATFSVVIVDILLNLTVRILFPVTGPVLASPAHVGLVMCSFRDVLSYQRSIEKRWRSWEKRQCCR